MKGKKALKITLISIGATLGGIVVLLGIAALIMLLMSVSYTDRSELPEAKEGIALSNWMQTIEDDALLADVAIAGSHDAGCEKMMWAYQTQNKSIAEQLEMGVRYFDLRLAEDEGVLKVFHAALIGGEFEPMAEAMRTFLAEHPSEVLLLDFQHFYSNDSKEAAYAAVATAFEPVAVHNTSAQSDVDYINALTIGEARGKCIVFWGVEDGHTDENWLFLRDNDDGTRAGSSLHSYYKTEYNTKGSKQYIEECLPVYWQQDAESNGGIFVLQGQLTDGLYVFGPAFVELTHDNNMNDYLAALPEDKVARINVVMRDYVTPKKCAITVGLNLKKGIVKQQYAAIVADWVV